MSALILHCATSMFSLKLLDINLLLCKVCVTQTYSINNIMVCAQLCTTWCGPNSSMHSLVLQKVINLFVFK